MSFLSLHVVVMVTVGAVFFRHFQGAIRTFSIVKGQKPAPQVQLFPLAAVLIFYQAWRVDLNPWLVAPGLIGFAASFALFEWSLATVRGHFFSYAYSTDRPEFLLTKGPYAYVRNPFYASYLLAYAASAIMLPGIVTAAVFMVMAWFLTSAARQEERKFATSTLADEYHLYKNRTGRFFPKL